MIVERHCFIVTAEICSRILMNGKSVSFLFYFPCYTKEGLQTKHMLVSYLPTAYLLAVRTEIIHDVIYICTYIFRHTSAIYIHINEIIKIMFLSNH